MTVFARTTITLAVGCIFAAGCGTMSKPFPHATEYLCRRAGGPINIDGNLDDAAWQRAGVLTFVVPGTFDRPQSPAEGRLLYDDTYLYIAYKSDDKDVWHVNTQRDDKTWLEDVVEVFFKLDDNQSPYYEFEFNAIGVIWDGFMSRRGAAGDVRRWNQWNSEGLRVATRVQGTLNHWQDHDKSWTCEVAIPLSDLIVPVGRTAQSGDRWKFHLARYDYSTYLEKGRELTSTAPLRVADFHYYEDYQSLVFE